MGLPPKFDSKTPYGRNSASKPIIGIATLGDDEKIEFLDTRLLVYFTLPCD